MWVTRVINTQIIVIMNYATSHLLDKVDLVFVKQLEMGEFELGVMSGVLLQVVEHLIGALLLPHQNRF